ncbi:Spy/CpxP family protein refolding chaperone [Reinekea sp.]|jgi:Spy/CpxP family protein refolding chaperone|uniref:Spy/CpxP family protein refolding chaperone n=1 Tax=Reinekea sp. TaxID=1970455 RepID=UPI0039899239
MNNKILAGLIAVTLVTSAGVTFAKSEGREAKNDNGQKYSQMHKKGDRANGMSSRLNFDYIFNQLSLDDETQVRVKAVMDTFSEEQRAKMSAQREEMRANSTKPSTEEMAALREARQTEATVALTDQLNTVLSPAQTAEFVEYLEAHIGSRGNGQQNHRGG